MDFGMVIYFCGDCMKGNEILWVNTYLQKMKFAKW